MLANIVVCNRLNDMRKNRVATAEEPWSNPFEDIGRILIFSALLTSPDDELDSLTTMELAGIAEPTKWLPQVKDDFEGKLTEADIPKVRALLDEGHTVYAALLGSVVEIKPVQVFGTPAS